MLLVNLSNYEMQSLISFCRFLSIFICFITTKSWSLNSTLFSNYSNVQLPSLSLFDHTSYSRPDKWITTFMDINWNINFKKQILKGYVDLTVRKQGGLNNDILVLDTSDLRIYNIEHVISNTPLNYTLHSPESFLGSKLEVQIPKNTTNITIRINYETSPNSRALKWLTPLQTAGKTQPYVFSQSQPNHARSMLPCQDTPAIKFTFTAKVTAPVGIVVLMGALKDDIKKDVHAFHQPIPIPTYLLAIAAGALEFRQISQRCGIWSEKEIVDKAAEEFSEAEQMLKAGEYLMGPYVWGRLDILVLPPSFPFGGMENPCLTFATPSLLAGDKSLTNVIAHEIAHSWTSNLVTNRNYEHFWLNEGFTVYLERKIIARLFGEKYRHFQAEFGWNDLIQTVKMFGANNKLTGLIIDMKGVDPDDSISPIPYEKGHTFFYYLERLVGGSDSFMPFIRAFVNEYKFLSIDTQQFIDFFIYYFKNKISQNILSSIDWKFWLLLPGMPPKPNYDKTLIEECELLNERWIAATDYVQFNKSDILKMSSLQICNFLSIFLTREPAQPISKIVALTEVYGLNETNNFEIKFRWIRIGIRSKWKDIVPYALKLVSETGRLKFVLVIFRELYGWEEVRQQAIDTYQGLKHSMAYITASIISKELHLTT